MTNEHNKKDKPHNDDQKSGSRCKNKKLSSSSSSLLSLLSSPAVSEVDSITTRAPKVRKRKPVEAEVLVLQVGEKNYAQALDYGIYQLASESSKYGETVSSYIVKLVKKVK